MRCLTKSTTSWLLITSQSPSQAITTKLSLLAVSCTCVTSALDDTDAAMFGITPCFTETHAEQRRTSRSRV
jgi:hypothetical protein